MVSKYREKNSFPGVVAITAENLWKSVCSLRLSISLYRGRMTRVGRPHRNGLAFLIAEGLRK